MAVAAAVAVGVGFLIGYPAEVAAAAMIALAATAALITVRDLAAVKRLPTCAARQVADAVPLEQLRQVSETLAAARVSEVAVDRDLRALMRPIAEMRLARRGVDLDRHPQQARALLGEQLWKLVRADRPRASNLRTGGIPAAQLQSVIERLERI